jgi:hypothetical protein
MTALASFFVSAVLEAGFDAFDAFDELATICPSFGGTYDFIWVAYRALSIPARFSNG